MFKLPFICCLLIVINCKAQNNWLNQATQLVTTDAAGNFNLNILDAPLRDAQIVSLGEQTHADGATFDAKVQLIKYLHQHLGFNVLAFESGYFDCSKANQLLSQHKSGILKNAVFGIWDNQSLADLEMYILSTCQTQHPLTVTGFDFQFSGSLSKQYLLTDLASYLNKQNAQSILTHPQWKAFQAAIQWQIKHSNFFTKTPPADTVLINKFCKAITSLQPGPESEYWKITLNNLAYDCQHRYKNTNYRDSIMAANLLAITKYQCPNQKVICWAASMHFIFNPQNIDDQAFKNLIPMGEHLHQALGSKLYTIAFTSFEGKAGTVLHYKLKQPETGSFESALAQTNYNYAFTNLHADTAGKQPIQCRILGNVFMKMVLPQVVDGVFYIKTSYPPR
jgi:erythromycin esterase